MAIKTISTTFKNALRNETVDFALALVGEPITIEHVIEVETIAIASTGLPIILNAKDGYIGDGWVVGVGGLFADFNVGDTINWGDYSTPSLYGVFTIVDKKSDDEIQLNSDLPATPDDFESVLSFFTVINPINAVRYYWNFIENNEPNTFQSKVDGSLQQAMVKEKLASDVTVTAMEFLGNKTYQIGDVSIQGVSIYSADFYRSRYKIIHNTHVTPFMLTSQWNDLQNGIAPVYLRDGKSLKTIFDFEAQYAYTNPNRIQSVQVTEVFGNIGWFNENFNTGKTNYTVDSITIKNQANVIIPAVELTTNETIIEAIIKNTTDAPFSNLNTKFILLFTKAPADATEYDTTTAPYKFRTQDHNFLLDYKLTTVGAAPVNGLNYGTDRQVLKSIEAEYISATQIKLKCKIALSATIYNELSALNEKRYVLSVITQNHTLATAVSDKVNLLLNAKDFFIDVSDPGLITYEEKLFIEHPDSLPADGQSAITAFPHDEIVHYTKFYMDRTNRVNDSIVFDQLKLRIKAKNTVTGAEFNLDSYAFQLNGFQLIDGAQFINQVINLPFFIPDTEIRKSIKIQRNIGLDTGNKKYYEVYFPFLMRWEYWQNLPGVNESFFDINQPNNGFNHLWNHYKQGNWKIFMGFELSVNKNGNLLNYPFEHELDTTGYDTNPSWSSETIKFFDPATNAQLYDIGTQKHFLKDNYTRVEARFKHITPIASLTGYAMLIDIEPYEGEGRLARRRISSVWPTGNNDDTYFESINATNKIVLSIEGTDTIVGKAIINNSLLPQVKRLTVVARLFDKNPPAGKQFQDGVIMNFQDGQIYEFQ